MAREVRDHGLESHQPGGHPVTDVLAAREQPTPVKNNGPCVQDLVVADIQARKAVGLERYGTLLQPHNGRDALRTRKRLTSPSTYVKRSPNVANSIPRARTNLARFLNG
jgi:hypothetical protein